MADLLWTDLAAEKGPFFRILYTTQRSQTGLMTIDPGVEAGPPETHEADQVFHVVEGEADVKVWSDGPDAPPRQGDAGPGTVIVVPAGMQHWVKSIGEEPLLFLTVYAPPAY